ncbi:MAG: HU family DNA-binding protein [Muribaculaceae bacterium]|nr:HU family DNA-binding protein [Muribaculaceae bacterium]
MDNKTLVNQMAQRLGRMPEDVSVILSQLSHVMADRIKEGDTLSVPGFGLFEPKVRAERETLHPSTGRRLLVPPKLTMIFRPSALLKQRVKK